MSHTDFIWICIKIKIEEEEIPTFVFVICFCVLHFVVYAVFQTRALNKVLQENISTFISLATKLSSLNLEFLQ